MVTPEARGGYELGSTAEAERSDKLLDALKEIQTVYHKSTKAYKIAKQAIENYNK